MGHQVTRVDNKDLTRSVRLRNTLRRAIGIALGVLLFSAISFAQNSLPSVRESVAVSLVEVPVTVLDSRGAPVRGLQLSDFRVFDDGKEIRPTSLDVTEFPSVPPERERPAAPERINPAAMRRFILLFDLSFITPAELSRARAAALRFIRDQSGPQDLLCVGSISAQKGASFMRGFTRDRGELEKGLDSLVTPVEMKTRTVTISPEDAPDVGRGQFTADELAWLQRPGRAKDAARIGKMILVLQKLAETLKSIDGRKQILLFSHGFDVMTDDTALLEPLNMALDALRRSDCIVHAVDIAGLRDGMQGSNSKWGTTSQEVLFTMASETSGQFVANSNDFTSQLGRILDATRLVYVLSLPARPSGHPGRFHTLKVKVARGGARVFARPGYEEPK